MQPGLLFVARAECLVTTFSVTSYSSSSRSAPALVPRKESCASRVGASALSSRESVRAVPEQALEEELCGRVSSSVCVSTDTGAASLVASRERIRGPGGRRLAAAVADLERRCSAASA